ncbi:MAG: phenylalanine--tRNA ligase subunit alpha [Candidatus Woesearchaeota archaeon]
MDIKKLIETLHPLERRVLPLLVRTNSLNGVMNDTKLPLAAVMRAFQWLENKEIVTIKEEIKEVVQLNKIGISASKHGLPEKRFISAIKDKPLDASELIKEAKLEKDELNACIGILRKKAAIDIKKDGNVMIISITEQGKKMLSKESLEESFLKRLSEGSVELKTLKDEERFVFENFKKRKDFVEVITLKLKSAELTELGKEIIKIGIKDVKVVDRLTHDMLKKGSWEGKTFRRYDVQINVPLIYGGKRHFVKQAIEYARKIWMDMGFKEMTGPILNTSFWNFDALFTAQDHPVREMQDTYYIGNPEKGKLPDNKIIQRIKNTHENGGSTESIGWNYSWNEEEAKRNVLRTHTTVLSAKTLKQLKKEDWPAKYFALGKCFRNETLDWSHLFEFNQTEGIVVDPDANFKNLLGYLKQFFAKMGFPQARFRPAFFPYTEPSIEIDVFHPIRKQWIELGGAGIFRPEVTEPLLGEEVPVLAWGPGFDRIIMDYYKITDMRDLYKNDIKQLREIKAWIR